MYIEGFEIFFSNTIQLVPVCKSYYMDTNPVVEPDLLAFF